MEFSKSTPVATYLPSPSPPLQSVIVTPCAACKILRRRCVEKCILAPYFPPNDPIKFTTAHRVFGASNIIKLLQDLPEQLRADAVSSMVYEANARLRDPVYGCAGAICQLQKQINLLQEQLAKAQAQLVNMHCQYTNLMAFICMEMTQPITGTISSSFDDQQSFDNLNSYQTNTSSIGLDENNNTNGNSLWELLST
ncbi:LOB domain-containing protein 11-like [Dorcoceras hygrometricum]|uniref:LOB domain-containing protein 11-like n=1 Tax=Dorcoceras hygrometricum TaxID=472368 RepID=A0A2Z7BKX0_9LAMI|nr:LOB domain-containing protein 11-like [Dorcoceras hygrometricum]